MKKPNPFTAVETLFGPRFLNPVNCTGFTYPELEIDFLETTLPDRATLSELALRERLLIVPTPPKELGYDWDLHDLVRHLDLRVSNALLKEKCSRDEKIGRGWIIIESVVPETIGVDTLDEEIRNDILLRMKINHFSIRTASSLEWMYVLKMIRTAQNPTFDPLKDIRHIHILTSSRLQETSKPTYSNRSVAIVNHGINGYDFGIGREGIAKNIGMAGVWKMV